MPSNCRIGMVEHSTNLHSRSYSPGEAIDVVCKSGYRKSYQNVVRCVAGSQTSPASLPTCNAQPCTLRSIAHSDVTSQRKLSPGERATVNCNEGYQISTTAQAECVTDSIFISPLPKCQAVPCPKSNLRIPNGRVLNTGDYIAPTAVLQIQCNADYTISYTGTVVCVSGHIFHPNIPSCNDRDCSRPYITNGRITSPSNTDSFPPDTLLSVTCDPGYDRVGSSRVRCVRANTFSPDISLVSCRAKPCELNRKPANGRFDKSRVDPGERITVICDPDYQLSFSTTVYCVTDSQYRVGTEQGDLPTCLPRPCPPPRIDHGSGLGPLNPGELLTVACFPGYVLSNETSVNCVAGGTFSSHLPQCLAQPCPVPKNIPHALPSSRSHINPGQLLQISCDPDYTLHNPSRHVRCVTLHQFTGTIPSCRARNCHLPDVPHGIWSSRNLAPGQAGLLECGFGYTGTGTLHVRCVSGNRLQPSSWDVQCVENCRVKGAIVPNGYLDSENGDTVRPGHQVRVRCDPEFQPDVAEELLTCVSGNTFSPATVRGCRPVPCPLPKRPDNGKYEQSRDPLNPGDTLSVTCERGYYVSGVTTVTCLTGRKFSGDIPRCRPQPCQVPTITNGTTLHDTSVLQPHQKLKYRCDDGYYNNDVKNVFCVTENQFSQPLPVCKPVRCPPPDIKYGTVSSSTVPGQQVNITCNPGLQPYPPDPVFCVTESIFHPPELPQCKAVPCIKPKTVDHGEILNTGSIEPGDELQIQCHPDYQISSAVRVACISGDVYTTGNVHSPETLPVCLPMPCKKPVVKNGVIETTGPIKPGDRVHVTCGADYEITGPGYLECTSRNEFKYRNQTVCRPKDCVSPKIKHGRFPAPTLRPGQTVKIQCDLGYKLDCDVNVTCISADNFQPIRLPQCLPQQCERPVIRDGSVTGPTPLIPNNTLIIQCRAGYRLTSNVPVTCVTLQQYDPPLLPHCVPLSNCTVPHLPHGHYEGAPARVITPGAKLKYTCNANPRYVPLFGPDVECLTGKYFHPSPPLCVAEGEVQSARLNYSRITNYRHELERTVVMEPTDTSNPPNTIVGVLIAVIVIFALIVLLLVFLLRNKQFKRRLQAKLGGTSNPIKYKPVVKTEADKKDVERGTQPATTVKRKPPAKPPPPKLPPAPSLAQPTPQRVLVSRTKPTKPAERHDDSSKNVYPILTSSETSSGTKCTDTELKTFSVYKPNPSKPLKTGGPAVKPVVVTDLRQGGGRSAFSRVPSSLTRPSTVSSTDLASSDLDSMDSESYERLLNDLGLTKADFKAKIPRSRFMMPEDYL